MFNRSVDVPICAPSATVFLHSNINTYGGGKETHETYFLKKLKVNPNHRVNPNLFFHFANIDCIVVEIKLSRILLNFEHTLIVYRIV